MRCSKKSAENAGLRCSLSVRSVRVIRSQVRRGDAEPTPAPAPGEPVVGVAPGGLLLREFGIEMEPWDERELPGWRA